MKYRIIIMIHNVTRPIIWTEHTSGISAVILLCVCVFNFAMEHPHITFHLVTGKNIYVCYQQQQQQNVCLFQSGCHSVQFCRSYTKHKYTRTGSLSGLKITFTETRIINDRDYVLTFCANVQFDHTHKIIICMLTTMSFFFYIFVLRTSEHLNNTLSIFFIHANYPLNPIFFFGRTYTVLVTFHLAMCAVIATNMRFLGICISIFFFAPFEIDA